MSAVPMSALVEQVLLERRSVRAFLPQPVDMALLDEVLHLAARAPSGVNMQPWQVHVITGTTLERLVEAVSHAFDAADASHTPEYAYYPSQFFEPYLTRRRQLGWSLYGLLGIPKGDTVAMRAQHRKNFAFFGAPVGLIFSIDRRLAQGSWLDYGMFLQSLMLAAQAHGLSTCVQAAWIDYHRIIGELLQFEEHQQLVCGMALGYADPAAPENCLISERVPVSEFVRRHT